MLARLPLTSDFNITAGTEAAVLSMARHGSAFGSWAGKWDLSKLVKAPQSALQQLGFSVRR